MANDERKRWSQVSPYLDEALDLEGESLAAWLRELEQRAPEICGLVRSLLSERERLERQPLLSGDPTSNLSHALLTGQQVGAYTLESVLGHGGMGTVWLARRSDGRFEGQVAVKLLNASLLGRPAEQRFMREGTMLAKLRHPHIAQLIDAGVAPGGQPYLALEYVRGERIDQYVRRLCLGVHARVRLFLDVLEAVAHAHSQLIVHRDLKPPNILVTSNGLVKLLDFGVAALIGPVDSELTREADVGLTRGYAAPEQLLGQRITTATDVYALGVVLCILLAEQHPFESQSTSEAELAHATLELEPLRASQLATDLRSKRILRGDLDNIVSKALKKNPSERYPTADALAHDLKRFLAYQPVSARADSLAYRAGKFVRRNRSGVVAGALTGLVVICATVLLALQRSEAQRERDAALYQAKRVDFQARLDYQSMSGPITIEEQLEKGIAGLEKDYGNDPRLLVHMLVGLSGHYVDRGDTNREYAALTTAERIARQIGDPDQIAFVQCHAVEPELAAGRGKRAEARLRDGLENLAKMKVAPVERRVECAVAQAKLSRSRNELAGAIYAAMRAAELMEAEHQSTDLRYRTIVALLEQMLAEADRLDEALHWNRRGLAALELVRREEMLSMSDARHEQAPMQYESGMVRTAFNTQRKTVQLIAARQGIDSVSPAMAQRLGLYQVRLEETEAGLAWIDRAVSTAAAQNNRSLQVDSLLSRAQAQLFLGHVDRVLADIEVAEGIEGIIDSEETGNALRRAQLLRAGLWFAQGRPSNALSDADRLVSGSYDLPRARNLGRILPAALTLKARAHLALSRPVEALSAARSALVAAEATAMNKERSADIGAALMALAEAQRAMGDTAHARGSADRAQRVLSNSLGTNHSETRAASLFRCCDR